MASLKTICSYTVSTLPQLLASFSVLLERAPSRTSATVTWTAYLCIGASWPSTSAATTMSWVKFFGTPPPIMNSPVSAFRIFSCVSS